MPRALVLAEDALGKDDGKTAHGLILHSMRDTIVAVIDSHHAGEDAGDAVFGKPVGIPVVADYSQGMAKGDIDALYLGAAPVGGHLPDVFRTTIQKALADGLTVYSGLHTFLADDPELNAVAVRGGGRIIDVRKPPEDLFVAQGRIFDCDTPRILVMGTDCAIGKRITVVELLKAARARGLDAGYVATGQTGCMLGPDAGAVIDRIPSDFCAGQVERMVCDTAEQGKSPVFLSGQSAILHPAFSGVALSILHGSLPHAVVLNHNPGRRQRALFDHPAYQVAPLQQEIDLIERLGDTKVVAVAVNGRGVENVHRACDEITEHTGLPAADPLTMDIDTLLDPALEEAQQRVPAPAPGPADFSGLP